MSLGCLAVAAVAAIAAQPVSALTWVCNLQARGRGAPIPPTVAIDLDEATSRVAVIDGLIKSHIGHPIEGQLRSVNANRHLFGWTVPGVKDNPEQYTPGLTFSLNIQRAGGAAQMTGFAQGYENHWRGTGTCTPR